MYVSIKVKAGFKREKGNSLKEEEIAIKGKRRGREGERERKGEREGEGEREGGRKGEKERKILRQRHTPTHMQL